MRPGDQILAQTLRQRLQHFNDDVQPLTGLSNPQRMDCLVNQIVDSVRRIKYVTTIANKHWSAVYGDALSPFFDPLKAAVWNHKNGNVDEAFWLVFLATHFGKNRRTGWSLVKETYGAMVQSVFWDWATASANPNAFKLWLQQNKTALKLRGNFSNHRKYESLDGLSANGTGAAVESYINWVGPSHQALIANLQVQGNLNSRQLFDALYHSMDAVVRFGRTARFDYLTMIGKLGLAQIEPPSTYMEGATGPKRGARLLFGGATNADISGFQLLSYLDALESHLGLFFGMQVLEDALCNWQKDPDSYQYFAG